MSIVYKLPQTSRYIPTNNTFSSAFGTPTIGKYDFNVAGNKNQVVVELQPNTIYFVDYFSISGNIASETFLSVISTQPTIMFNKLLSKEILFTRAIPISAFAPQIYIGSFVKSVLKNDALIATFDGVLSQNSDLIGVTPVSINLKLSLFAMDEISYNKVFLDRESL